MDSRPRLSAWRVLHRGRSKQRPYGSSHNFLRGIVFSRVLPGLLNGAGYLVLICLGGLGVAGVWAKDLTVQDCSHSADQVLGGLRFQKAAIGTGAEYFVDDALGIVDGEDQNLGARTLGDDLAEGCETIENRHVQIENHEIRSQLKCFFDGFAAIHGFPADLPVQLSCKQSTNALAHNFVVIGNEHAHFLVR